MAWRYQAYPAYKPSGVEWLGDIPEGWSLKRLKTLFKIKKRIAGQLGHEVLSITQGGMKVKDIKSGDGQLAMDYSKYQLVYTGDFAMNHMDLLTGYVDISNFDGVTSPDYRVFSIEDEACDPVFFLNLFQHCYKAKIFFPLGQGAAHLGRWRLPTEAFNNFLAPVPSIPEQTQIAAFLDHETAKIDALIAKQQRLIALLEEKRQAVISHAVTKGLNPDAPLRPSGIDWLGDVPAHWEVKRLKFLCSVNTGTRNTEDAIENGKYPFFVRSQTVQRINTGPYDCEVILTAGDGAGVGKVYHYFEGRFDCHQRVYMLTDFEELIGKFIFDFLENNFFNVALAGQAKSTVDSLRMPVFLNFELTVPPHQEQQKIVVHVATKKRHFSALTQQAQSAITLLKERRTALISAAVTGKIDVRDWRPPHATSAQDCQPPKDVHS
ncbi:MAG: restriction endonuclease subunit S [Shimia thalassica]|uniref:restriction endonuclease subunit S n=1 Tax=Shimia thalassica TaxID=1715693 RepID=UPI003298E253